MRRNSPIAILAILISGCAARQPEPVYVNLDRVLIREATPEMIGAAMPQPMPPSQPVTVKQPGLPATATTDRTLERLELAKKLISENRGKSIASLSAMLKRVYLAQAEDEIEKRSKDIQPAHDEMFAAAFARIRETFERYGLERGPLLTKLSITARNISLEPQTAASDADLLTQRNIIEANKLRTQIKELDKRYDDEADLLLADAEKAIQAEIAQLKQEADATRAQAETKAVNEAESKATQTQTSLDVDLKHLVPEALPSVPGRQVVIPGTTAMPAPPQDAAKAIFGSLEERRRLLDQEIDIWIKSSGRSRSMGPQKGIRDVTEEFLLWKSAHKTGP